MYDLPTGGVLSAATTIVSSYVAANSMPAQDVPSMIVAVVDALQGRPAVAAPGGQKQKPAVSISKSVANDYLICLEDGKKLKMLKRYLMSRHGMTPAEYRAKWGLPLDYPMVAPDYAQMRSKLSRSFGFGTRRKAA